jgi:two-component system, chemotaxis family, protein-glutamate methylesterase/glutaminase
MNEAAGGHDLVAIGASWGGLDALRTILRGLPASLDAAVVVAQHRAASSHPTALRDLLTRVTALKVCDADDKAELRHGSVYIAAPDYHVLIEDGSIALATDAPVLYARPSVDVLLESAAESYLDRCVGVVLTGANDDGARGLKHVVDHGGAAIVQEPSSAARDEMPRAALAAVPDARVAPVEEIAALVIELCGERVAA